ncbi:MAG: hypothetical protein KatS3mg122_0617 [Caldimonas sp.]|uniref:acyltransferase family protein n=1 Tax=Caldimonas taiwanensis TaxID=307483 RepID=UPI0007824CFC|nr:acyltransferase [Caldimonas taiwanensis]GIX23386.1 MAG: hypothetical protein KatS3mg122_0617 [Caldimonas sp.]
MSLPPPRYPGLDGIRALAVAAVVWDHTIPYEGMPAPLRHGFLGVDVFFVLSGFLITALLLQERASHGRISLGKFFIRRCLRIFPLYFAVMGLLATYFVFFAPASSSQRTAFLTELPYHLTYTSNWVPMETMMGLTWSLSTEEQFYLLWPAMLAFLESWAWLAMVVFLILNQAVNFGAFDGALQSVGLSAGSLEILQCTFTPIILGSMLAFALSTAHWRDRLAAWPAWPVLLLAAGVLLVTASWPGDIRGWPRLGFQSATAVLLAVIVLHPTGHLARVLEWRPLAYVGTVSYGIYLLHMFVVHVTRRVLIDIGAMDNHLLFLLSLAGAVAVASLSYRYFERPLLQLKDRFR